MRVIARYALENPAAVVNLGEDERARVQSAASTLDMLARMLILPLAGRLISK